MKFGRRTFLAAAGAAIAASPLAALAQAAARRPLVGFLVTNSREADRVLRDVLQGMNDLGYVEGRDFTVAARYSDGINERLPALAAELVALTPDVIVANAAEAKASAFAFRHRRDHIAEGSSTSNEAPMTRPTPAPDKWSFHADDRGRWRWSLTTPDHTVVRASAEAYPNRAAAVKNAKQYGYVGATDSFGTSVPLLRSRW